MGWTKNWRDFHSLSVVSHAQLKSVCGAHKTRLSLGRWVVRGWSRRPGEGQLYVCARASGTARRALQPGHWTAASPGRTLWSARCTVQSVGPTLPLLLSAPSPQPPRLWATEARISEGRRHGRVTSRPELRREIFRSARGGHKQRPVGSGRATSSFGDRRTVLIRGGRGLTGRQKSGAAGSRPV